MRSSTPGRGAASTLCRSADRSFRRPIGRSASPAQRHRGSASRRIDALVSTNDASATKLGSVLVRLHDCHTAFPRRRWTRRSGRQSSAGEAEAFPGASPKFPGFWAKFAEQTQTPATAAFFRAGQALARSPQVALHEAGELASTLDARWRAARGGVHSARSRTCRRPRRCSQAARTSAWAAGLTGRQRGALSNSCCPAVEVHARRWKASSRAASPLVGGRCANAEARQADSAPVLAQCTSSSGGDLASVSRTSRRNTRGRARAHLRSADPRGPMKRRPRDIAGLRGGRLRDSLLRRRRKELYAHDGTDPARAGHHATTNSSAAGAVATGDRGTTHHHASCGRPHQIKALNELSSLVTRSSRGWTSSRVMRRVTARKVSKRRIQRPANRSRERPGAAFTAQQPASSGVAKRHGRRRRRPCPARAGSRGAKPARTAPSPTPSPAP